MELQENNFVGLSAAAVEGDLKVILPYRASASFPPYCFFPPQRIPKSSERSPETVAL